MKGFTAADKWYTSCERAFVPNTDKTNRTKLDPAEVAKAFDFDIVKCPTFTNDGREIGGLYHLRRSDTDGIVPSRGLGPEYRPIQHHSVYKYVVNEIMPKIPEMELESVGTFHGGGTGIISAVVGDKFSIKGDRSDHRTRLFICNPNGGTGSCIIGSCVVRLFCQNQIPAAIRNTKKNGGFSIHHSTNADIYVENAVETVTAQIQYANALRLREERLAELPVNQAAVARVLDRLFPLGRFEPEGRGWNRMNNQRLEVLRQFEDGETAQEFTEKNGFCLFSSITRQIYNPKTVGDKTDLAQIRYSGSVGSRAKLVHKVLDVVERELGAVA